MHDLGIVSTGIPALDKRIRGLSRGRYYLLSGLPGAGKTTAALQFIQGGLEAGETCAIVTQDDPADLLAQGDFLGFDFRQADQAGKLIVLRFRLDFARNYARTENARVVIDELQGYLDETRPSRLVIDSLLPLLDGGRVSDVTLAAFQQLLERSAETTLLIAPGNLGKDFYIPIYDRLVVGVGGILEFELQPGQVRELNVRKMRHGDVSAEPFPFLIRAGAGIVERVTTDPHLDFPPEVLRRVVLLDPSGQVGPDLLLEIGSSYELVSYRSVEKAYAELVTGRFGALMVTLDPMGCAGVLEFIASLRAAGNGAPVLLFSTQRGLRSSTRLRALQAGGDDFLTDALSPQEILQRIAIAQERGHRRTVVDPSTGPVVLQPLGEAGEPLPLPESSLRVAVAQQLEVPHSVFALATVWPGPHGLDRAFNLFAQSLRTGEGDLVSILDNGQLGLYIPNIRRSDADRLLARLSDSNPGGFDAASVNTFCFPRDRKEVQEWANGEVLANLAH